ncbi:MAG: RIP metalloprotease RseP [Candidatus Marinimicrobia bacterium]|nr:RIP metalloprotease RseP [Candidatus Neomarinimicrobiota bacterium]
MIYIISTIVVLGILVFIHEFGHFIAAKIVGIRVDKFSLGFPPKIVGKKIGETEYCLSWIPLGGYVKLAGMMDESMDEDYAKNPIEPYEYRAKKWWQKIFVASAGVIMNLLLAILIFTIFTFKTGIPDVSNDPIINEIAKDMPAAEVGLQSGDRIISVNGYKIEKWEDMSDVIHNFAGKKISLKYERSNEVKTVKLTPVLQQTVVNGSITKVGMIGISGKIEYHSANFGEAISSGVKTTYYWFKLTVSSLGMLIKGEESLKNVGGLVMIGQLAGESARNGLMSLFSLIAILSVNLAFINILPIPALDGGHIIIAIIEGIIGRELNIKVKMAIQQIGTFLLLGLIVLVMINDISRLFR